MEPGVREITGISQAWLHNKDTIVILIFLFFRRHLIKQQFAATVSMPTGTPWTMLLKKKKSRGEGMRICKWRRAVALSSGY